MNHWNRIIPIVMDNLPRDVDARRETVEALLHVLPAEHPAYAGVRAVLEGLISHRLAQRELLLSLQEEGE